MTPERLRGLLGRGFQLAQAVERWHTRAIWVVSRADQEYPRRMRESLGEQAPPVLYGCGELSVLAGRGLAVVGSRRVDGDLLEYTRNVGELAARAGWMVVSGGAKGVDQAAMRGGLDAGGQVTGVLANGLEGAALQREHRSYLMDGQLVLVSPYDPSAGFHVGNAMARNKLIYAQAQAALVVNADYQKGGTWSGAVEALRSGRPEPVYVRWGTQPRKGLRGLQERGARPWPEPWTPDELTDVLTSTVREVDPLAVVSTSQAHGYSAGGGTPGTLARITLEGQGIWCVVQLTAGLRHTVRLYWAPARVELWRKTSRVI